MLNDVFIATTIDEEDGDESDGNGGNDDDVDDDDDDDDDDDEKDGFESDELELRLGGLKLSEELPYDWLLAESTAISSCGACSSLMSLLVMMSLLNGDTIGPGKSSLVSIKIPSLTATSKSFPHNAETIRRISPVSIPSKSCAVAFNNV